jgi:hypothetical protein
MVLHSRMRLPDSSAARDRERRRVPQQELQEDVQRFAVQLIERTGRAAVEIMGSAGPDKTSTEALRRAVIYESAALDIATELVPEIALLDLLVFVHLNRRVLSEYWIPNVLGERGRPFLAAFEQAEGQLVPIASKLLDAGQREALIRHVDEWRSNNPELILVEFVRLNDFSARAGGGAAVARPEEVRGLLASVRSATKSADQAVLLAERALFLASKLPFVLRHQARLGAREVIGDTMDLLGSTDALVESVKNLQPILAELRALETGGIEALRESRLLLEELKSFIPTPEHVARLEHTVEAGYGLMKRLSARIGDVRASTIERGSGRFIRRLARRVGTRTGRAKEARLPTSSRPTDEHAPPQP